MSFGPPSKPDYPPPSQQPYAPPNMMPEQQPPSPNAGCGWTTCLLGCLGICAITAIGLCAGSWYVYNNAGRWGADLARSVIVSAVNESELAADDKTEIVAQVDRVTNAYKDGKITFEDLGKVMESLAQSPLMPLIVVYGIDEKYIRPSGLTEEEKTAARATLNRVVRGAFEQKISEQELDPLLDDVSVKRPNGQRQLHERLSDDELKSFLVKAKKLADDKMIPEEEFKFDIGEEFKKAVDNALKGKGL